MDLSDTFSVVFVNGKTNMGKLIFLGFRKVEEEILLIVVSSDIVSPLVV